MLKKYIFFFEPFMIFAKKSQILIIVKVKMLYLNYFFCQKKQKQKNGEKCTWQIVFKYLIHF